jgi:ABC-type bacteriocin/lantibiotic exporter with double-glycine peptidase domain
MSDTARLPFVLGLCFTLFFYYVGLSFLAGLAVFILALIINASFGYCFEEVQKTIMKRKDARMNETTEALNHIKSLKLNSWQDLFYKRIVEKRRLEIQALRK